MNKESIEQKPKLSLGHWVILAVIVNILILTIFFFAGLLAQDKSNESQDSYGGCETLTNPTPCPEIDQGYDETYQDLDDDLNAIYNDIEESREDYFEEMGNQAQKEMVEDAKRLDALIEAEGL